MLLVFYLTLILIYFVYAKKKKTYIKYCFTYIYYLHKSLLKGITQFTWTRFRMLAEKLLSTNKATIVQINVMSLSGTDKNCLTFYWANIKNITNRWPLGAAVAPHLEVQAKAGAESRKHKHKYHLCGYRGACVLVQQRISTDSQLNVMTEKKSKLTNICTDPWLLSLSASWTCVSNGFPSFSSSFLFGASTAWAI